MALKVVPNLDQIATDPATVGELSAGVVEALLVQHHKAGGALLGRLLALRATGDGQVGRTDEDRLLDVKEAAARLGMSPASLYRRHKNDPTYHRLTVDMGTRKLLFSEREVEALKRRRTGR